MVKRIVWIVIGIAVLGGLFVAFQPQPVAVDMGTVQRGDVRSFVEEEGKTRVVQRYVVAAPVAGRLLRLKFDEGDTVKKGQVVAEVDPLPLRNEVLSAEAQVRELQRRIEGVDRKKPKQVELDRAATLETVAERSAAVARDQLDEAEAQLRRAELEKERVVRLMRAKAVTSAEMDEAETAESAARARRDARKQQVEVATLRLAAARLNTKLVETRLHDYDWEKKAYEQQIAAVRSRLEVLRDNLARARIEAPADGVVLNIFQESQRVVQAGEPLFDVGRLDRMEIEVEYLSEDAAHMKVGMPAEIFGRALGDRVVPTKIKRIYPSAFLKISSLGVEQQRVIVVVDAPASLGLGDRFRVQVRTILDARRDALLVPEGALFRYQGGWHAFKVTGGRATRVAVDTGLRDGRAREVLGGLAEGDTVILHPDDSISDGTEVSALPK